jgi:hypothetical protein
MPRQDLDTLMTVSKNEKSATETIRISKRASRHSLEPTISSSWCYCGEICFSRTIWHHIRDDTMQK